MTNPYNQPPRQSPQIPAWGPPQPPPGTPPPKQSNAFKTTFLGCLGIIVAGLVLFAGCAALGGVIGEVDPSATPEAPAASSTEAAEEDATPEARRTNRPPSEAAEFKSCIKKNGTSAEKKAVAKVTKVTGVETRNNIFDNAEVWTTLQGGLMGPDGSTANIIASAFGTCYQSDNGLVTVYGEDGKMLANGNF